MTRTWLTLLVTLTLLGAGCLSGSDAPASDASPAEDTNTTTSSDSGIVGRKSAFQVSRGDGGDADTIHPYVVDGQEAREPVELTFEETFTTQDCTAPVAASPVNKRWVYFPLTDHLRAGDAVLATVTLTFENRDESFAEIRLWAQAPDQYLQHEEAVADERGTVEQTLEFQFAYPDGGAWVAVGAMCWWGVNPQDIPFTIDVRFDFAEGVIPAGTPHLIPVDGNVSEIRVSGVAATPGGTVTGHYRLFAPDDTLLGEYALNSDEGFDAVRVTRPGDYVIIVDHSEGGMLGVGADAPPAEPHLEVLSTVFGGAVLVAQDTMGPVGETVTFDIPRVPLYLGVWTRAPEAGAGGGREVEVHLEGPRGLVEHRKWPLFATFRPPGASWSAFYGLSPTGWEYMHDHHAYAKGPHVFTADGEAFQGEILAYYATYARPGDEGRITDAVTPQAGGALAGLRVT